MLISRADQLMYFYQDKRRRWMIMKNCIRPLHFPAKFLLWDNDVTVLRQIHPPRIKEQRYSFI